MSWGAYGAFVAIAVVLVLTPGLDFTVVVRNALVGGRRRGLLAGLGVASSNAIQGGAAAFGLGAFIVRSQWLFETIRWAGVAYLGYLGARALLSVWEGRSVPWADPGADAVRPGRGYRQGFLSNITNPKVLAFYLSIFPQFLDPGHARLSQLVLLAVTHAVLSLTWLSAVVGVVARVRRWLSSRPVRRALDAVTGTVLIGFAVRLASESR